MFATTRELIEKYREAPFNSNVIESSSSNFFDEAPSSQELRMATPTKKNKNTNKKQKKIQEDEKNFCGVCDVKHNSKVGIDYGSPWIGCEVTKCYWVHYSVLASLQKIQKVLVNGFVKVTIQLRNQTIKESLKKYIK